MKRKKVVLILEPISNNLNLYHKELTKEGFGVFKFLKPDQKRFDDFMVARLKRQQKIDLAIINTSFDGDKILTQLKNEFPNIEIIEISGDSSNNADLVEIVKKRIKYKLIK